MMSTMLIPLRLYRCNTNVFGILKQNFNKCEAHNQQFKMVSHQDVSRSRYYLNAVGLSSSARVSAKVFLEFENNFAHQLMESLPTYSNTIFQQSNLTDQNIIPTEEFHNIVSKDWNSEPPDKICQAFGIMSRFASNSKTNVSLTDKEFNGISRSIVANTSSFQDKELAEILSSLSFWPQTDSLNSPNFVNIWSALDKECVSRIKQWNVDTMLYFADLWFTLHLSRVCEYMWHCIKRTGRKPSKLTPSQLVQIMFYVNVCRKVHDSISMYEFEYSIESNVDKFTINEVAILAMGFFKSQTRIRSPTLLTSIIEKTTSEIDTINEVSLSSILKVVRYSLPLTHADMLMNLLNKAVPNIPRLSLLCCLHILLAGTNVQIFQEELFKILSQRFVENISTLRIKDIERLAFGLSLYDYDPKTVPCIYEKILEELGKSERIEETEKYPRCLASSLHYLTLRNIYPINLISKVLDNDFITNTYGKYHKRIGREILSLDLSVSIDCPTYNGNRLSSKIRQVLVRDNVCWNPNETKKKLSITDKLMLEIVENIKLSLGGSKFLYIGHILPHFPRADIVFGLTESQSAIEIPTEFKKIRLGEIKYAPTEGNVSKWYCFLVGGWNCFIRNSEVPVGSVKAKMRQLKVLGYHPIIIPWFEWNKLTISQKREYTRQKICNQH